MEPMDPGTRTGKPCNMGQESLRTAPVWRTETVKRPSRSKRSPYWRTGVHWRVRRSGMKKKRKRRLAGPHHTTGQQVKQLSKRNSDLNSRYYYNDAQLCNKQVLSSHHTNWKLVNNWISANKDASLCSVVFPMEHFKKDEETTRKAFWSEGRSRGSTPKQTGLERGHDAENRRDWENYKSTLAQGSRAPKLPWQWMWWLFPWKRRPLRMTKKSKTQEITPKTHNTTKLSRNRGQLSATTTTKNKCRVRLTTGPLSILIISPVKIFNNSHNIYVRKWKYTILSYTCSM